MKLLFKQRAFTWFDSYDIYDENENTVYVVKGQLSWGHCLKIFDASEEHELGTVREQIFSWWPQEGADFFLVAPIRTLRGERLHRHPEKRTVGLVQTTV